MSWFSRALGQLLFAKMKHNLDDLWLIVPKLPSILSKDWVKLLWSHNITILFFSDGNFNVLTTDLLRFPERPVLEAPKDLIEPEKLETIPKRSRHIFLRSLHIDHRIFNLLKKHPEGLTIGEIARKLGMRWETVKAHTMNPTSGIVSDFSILKNKIIIENKKIRLYATPNNPIYPHTD